MQLDPQEFLSINDAYHFFEQAGGLIKTGPTHTNVMDLRVALVDPAKRELPRRSLVVTPPLSKGG